MKLDNLLSDLAANHYAINRQESIYSVVADAVSAQDEIEHLRQQVDEYRHDHEAMEALRRRQIDTVHYEDRREINQWHVTQYGDDAYAKMARASDPADAILEYVARHHKPPPITPAEKRLALCDLFRRLAWRAVVDWDGVRTSELVDAIYEATGEQNPMRKDGANG